MVFGSKMFVLVIVYAAFLAYSAYMLGLKRAEYEKYAVPLRLFKRALNLPGADPPTEELLFSEMVVQKEVDRLRPQLVTLTVVVGVLFLVVCIFAYII